MDTFEFTLQNPLDDNYQPKINKFEFGDGYVYTSRKGLNHNLKKFSLKYRGTSADAELVNNFLIKQGGYKTFLWKHPVTGITHKVKCYSWRRSSEGINATMSFEFEEVLV